MEVKKVISKDLKREFDVTIFAKDINEKIDQKLTDIAKRAKFPGFRPGKAPLHLVKKNYGKSVMGEIIEKVINESSNDLMKKENLRPALRPKFEILSFKEDQDLKYKIKFELFPEVPDVKVEDIKLDKLIAEASEEEVDVGMNRLAKSYKDFEKEDGRVAKDGDAVVIDFTGRINGVEFDGGKAEGFQLELGSKSFIDTFEEQLEGKKAGDKVDVKVTFPKNYGKKELANKKAVFEVKVHEVKKSVVPALNDEFAKKLGLDSLDKLREAVKKQVQSDYDAVGRTLLKKELFDKLEKKAKFSLPEEMVKMEFDAIWQPTKKAIERGDIEKGKEGKLEKEYTRMAERRVKLGIFLSEYGKKHEVKVSNEELSKAIFAKASQFPGQESKVFEYYTNNMGALEELRGPILEDKVVDFIISKVDIKEKKVAGKKLIEEGEKLQEEEMSMLPPEDDNDDSMPHQHGPECADDCGH